MDEESIVETLGPIEDPSIVECLLTVLDTANLSACGIDAINCESPTSQPGLLQVVDLPPAAAARPNRPLSLWRGRTHLPALRDARA